MPVLGYHKHHSVKVNFQFQLAHKIWSQTKAKRNQGTPNKLRYTTRTRASRTRTIHFGVSFALSKQEDKIENQFNSSSGQAFSHHATDFPSRAYRKFPATEKKAKTKYQSGKNCLIVSETPAVKLGKVSLVKEG